MWLIKHFFTIWNIFKFVFFQGVFLYGLKLNEPTFLPHALFSTPHVNSKSSNRLHLLPSYRHVYILNLVDYFSLLFAVESPHREYFSKWEHLPTCVWHDMNSTHNVYYFTELSPLFTVYFDSTCVDLDTYTIFDDDTYYIKWRGSKLSSSCSYKFSPYDTDYKVCVEAEVYNVNDCNVSLQYYGGYIGTLLKRVLFDFMNIH